MENKKNLFVTLSSKDYVQQAKALFSSVYWNAGWKGDYMLLSHGIPEKELKWFRDKGILVRKCKPLYKEGVGVQEFRPSVVTSKFYLFTPEFKKWKNIIFLEGDIMVKASLDRLANIKGFYATDVFDKSKLKDQISDNNPEMYNLLKRRYNLEKPSFNSGVMIFNSDIIKENSFENLLKIYDKFNGLSKYGEEGIINLFLYNQWKKLPYVYNMWHYPVANSCKIDASKMKGIIFHFISSFSINSQLRWKPWDEGNLFYNEWNYNLKKTEFIDLKKIPSAKNKWGIFKIWIYPFYLKFRRFYFSDFPIYLGNKKQLIFKFLKKFRDSILK